MRTWLWCVLALASGCIVPRSMTIGQMGAPVGRGATDVGVYTGFLYASQTNPTLPGTPAANGDATTNQEKTNAFSIPAIEANIQHGFSDRVGLNVHASSAGLQPGLKLTLTKSKIASLSLMPQVAFGYASLGASTYVAGPDGVQVETAPHSSTSFTFLAGLKVLFSHRSGFYAGVGYDFIFNRNYNASIVGSAQVGDKSEIVYSTTAHQISASIGLDITLGMVHLRPEVAFAVYPGIAQNVTGHVGVTDMAPVGGSGGFGFAIFPGFTLAVVSPKHELTDEEQQEEEEVQKADKKAKKKGDDAEDDDEDEDTVKRPTGKKKAKLDDDDEDAPKNKKRRPVDTDED